MIRLEKMIEDIVFFCEGYHELSISKRYRFVYNTKDRSLIVQSYVDDGLKLPKYVIAFFVNDPKHTHLYTEDSIERVRKEYEDVARIGTPEDTMIVFERIGGKCRYLQINDYRLTTERK